MPPSYEPLPSNDSEQELTSVAQKPDTRKSGRNLLLLILGFIFTAFVSYKAGQWSVSLLSSASAVVDVPASTPTQEIELSQEKNETGVSMSGKYSVG